MPVPYQIRKWVPFEVDPNAEFEEPPPERPYIPWAAPSTQRPNIWSTNQAISSTNQAVSSTNKASSSTNEEDTHGSRANAAIARHSKGSGDDGMRDKSTSLEKGEPSKGSGEQGNGGVPTSRAEGTGHDKVTEGKRKADDSKSDEPPAKRVRRSTY